MTPDRRDLMNTLLALSAVRFERALADRQLRVSEHGASFMFYSLGPFYCRVLWLNSVSWLVD
jgi:hypothetical protein